MRLDLYLAETRLLAQQQSDILDSVAGRLDKGEILSDLESNGVLHALQLLIENAIGKAKHLLKASGHSVPVSAYDTMKTLVKLDLVASEELLAWNAVIGLRNRIVHEYLNLDLERVFELVQEHRYRFVVDFLNAPLPDNL